MCRHDLVIQAPGCEEIIMPLATSGFGFSSSQMTGFYPWGEDPVVHDDPSDRDPEMDEKMNMMLDVLDSEGHFIMSKPRSVVHKEGFWHRALNVWVVDMSTGNVLIGQRPITKGIDPGKWTCVTGRVESGQLSLTSALEQLFGETSIKMEDSLEGQMQLMFSIKCAHQITNGVFAGQRDATWLDVYAACLQETIPIEQMKLDTKDKQAAKYISIDKLHEAYVEKNPDFVIPSNEEYTRKLFQYLRTLIDSKPRWGRSNLALARRE